ncbi:hypothetical protein [Parabacteroides bouchesdurhonensis]|uniref:hypothetical protein n=1 Tax=Parabacteroides bouchesdurhonensis TaxID=1936995 RepID=UPI000C81DF92|nr:hypothetical protein [Parabacteroides bouchesdurhonensis]
MKIILSIFIFIIMIPFNAFSQEHNHAHARNEIGISPGATYSSSHHEWGFGVHAHYFRTLGNHSPWALGGSIEQVSSHGSHWTLSAGGKYELFDKLNIAIMPGITFFNHKHEHNEEHEHTKKVQFSTHFELVYNLIHLEHFHLGPAIDFSWTKHDNHFMLGIHCAYGF